MKTDMTRREFLKRSSLVVAVAAVPGSLSLFNASPSLGGADTPFKPNAYVEIATDDTVTVWIGQTNLGQGTHTGISMIIADELDSNWNKVQSKMAWAAEPFKNPKLWNLQVTGGSTSIWHHHPRFYKAGAAARQMLKEAAAKQWGVSASKLRTRDSRVIHPDGRKLRYGELVEAAAKLPVPKNPVLKDPKAYRIIGTERKRHDIPDKVMGKTKYGMDYTMPGMCYAVLAYPPRYGAVPESYDADAAMAVKGVFKVVPLEGRVAVCAETTYAAIKGRDALKVKWSAGSHPTLNDDSIDALFRKHLENADGIGESEGDTEKALYEAAIVKKGAFKLPYLSHAQVEPINSTVSVEKDRCKVWIPTQGQTFVQMAVSKALGWPIDKVELMTTPVGGGFGLRAFETGSSIDAALVSKAIKRPVKVVLTREDCFSQELFRPGIQAEIKGGLDEKGELVAWSHKIASQSIMSQLGPQMGMKGGGVDHFLIEGVAGMPYKLENVLLKFSVVDLPIPVTFWRSVGMSSNVFTVECFMDEMAHAAKKDPVQFRLDHLPKDSRTYNALSVLAEKVNWGGPVPEGRARGVAAGTFFNSAIAHMAEVSVTENGSVKVHKVVCAVDCGLAVCPDQIKAQAEGGVIMGLSTAFYEKVSFANGGVETSNYDDYPVLTMSEIPEIEVHIAKSKHSLGGIGETVYPTVAPAVANAIFKATGVRIRELPINRELLAKG